MDEVMFRAREAAERGREAAERGREAAQRARDAMRDSMRESGRDNINFNFDFDVETKVEIAMEKARAAAGDMNFKFEGMNGKLFAQAGPKVAPLPPMPPMPAVAYAGKQRRSGDSEERLYRRGAEYLDRREWEKAIDEYDQVIDKKGIKADGAYYWKAYALSKLGRRDPALAALVEMKKSYPSSRWLNDAKALEAEVQQASGQGPSPERENDEDLKLFAINSLMNSDPERALPLLEKILQKSSAPKLRERALFVLAQSRSPKSNEIVAQFARGGGNPDLQQKAVEYLGVYGGKDNLQILGDIYGSANDPALKRNILRSFMVAHDKDRLLTAAKSEQNPDLRRDAIQYLGNLNASAEIAQLYTADQPQEIKEAIIQALANNNISERLVEIARTEKDPRVRSNAIHRLGNMSRTKTSEALVSLYGPEQDRNVKEQIIQAPSNQGSAKELVDVARKETDPELKKTAIKRLANMHSKEATDFMVELINK